jgi:hypothetical protein
LEKVRSLGVRGAAELYLSLRAVNPACKIGAVAHLAASQAKRTLSHPTVRKARLLVNIVLQMASRLLVSPVYAQESSGVQKPIEPMVADSGDGEKPIEPHEVKVPEGEKGEGEAMVGGPEDYGSVSSLSTPPRAPTLSQTRTRSASLSRSRRARRASPRICP